MKKLDIPLKILVIGFIILTVLVIIIVNKFVFSSTSDKIKLDNTTQNVLGASTHNNVINSPAPTHSTTNATTTIVHTTTVIPTTTVIATDKWIYYPVDKSTSLSQSFVPDNLVLLSSFGLPSVVSSYSVRKQIIPDLVQMFNDGKAQGINLKITSSYRSYNYQATLFQSYVSEDIQKGMSADAAQKDANRSSAYPGHSEHQLGTTMDIISASDITLDNTATNLKAWGWLDSHIEQYGFVLSYPEGKEDKTGYINEPWHIRWVGKDIAQKILAINYKNPNNINTSTSYLKTVWQGLNQ